MKIAGDLELIRRFRNGDRRCFDELYNRLIPEVYPYIVSILNNRDSADEVLQALFSRFFQQLEQFEKAENFRSYFFSCARNESLAYLKSIHDRKKFTRRAKYIFDHEQEQEEISMEEIDEVNFMLSHLNESYREVVSLKLFSGFTFVEIATLLNQNQDAVESRYRAALKKLKSSFV